MAKFMPKVPSMKTQNMTSRMSGRVRTYANPSRTPPRPAPRGTGSSSAGRMAPSAARTARKLTALTMKAGPTPTAAMRRPPTPGPTSRAAWNDAELSPTALARWLAGTSSDTNACRVGLSRAFSTPCSRVSR